MKYGYRRGLIDARDFTYAPEAKKRLPTKVDLRAKMPPIYDQGELGSCVAHASEAAYRYTVGQQKLPDFEGSRLGLYYMTRAFEHMESVDGGSIIRDALKIMLADGLIPAADWPYNVSKFAERPPQTAYHKALAHKVSGQYGTGYYSLKQDGSTYHVRHALAQGRPVIFGFTVYDSFESNEVAQTGIVPMPDTKHEKIVGGHAVLAVGYDNSDKTVIVRNSWGLDWGLKGYCKMPMGLVCSPNFSDDLWTLVSVKEGSA